MAASNPILELLAKDLKEQQDAASSSKHKQERSSLKISQDDLDCYTAEDLMQMWHCKIDTIRRYREAGLPTFDPMGQGKKRKGVKLLFPKAAVRKWFRANIMRL